VLAVPDRLLEPHIRINRHLQTVSWTQALDHIASRLAAIQRAHGREAVAVFGGGGLTNEKSYALGKFARAVLRTPYIDYNGRFCMSSAAAASNRAFGMDRGLGFPLPDLGGADAVLILGSNVAATMPPARPVEAAINRLRDASQARTLVKTVVKRGYALAVTA
jgi:assimilatory nitrate reductase catalytic subunit